MLTSPDQARRIDRLARGAHLFHRYAHHPLCDAYAGEVIRLGRRTRLCRGCSSAAAGVVAGALVALTLPVLSNRVLTSMALAVALSVAGSFLRRDSADAASTPRRSKLLTRALPAALVVATAVAGARGATRGGWLVSAVTLAILASGVLAYRRRGPDRRACDTCAERSPTVICSGLRPIARREAAFARLARRTLTVVGPPGPVIGERADGDPATRPS